MFAAAIIVFREVLEASLIVSVMMAATRGVPGRLRWLAGGVLLGLLGSVVVASSMEVIASLADGLGQELFNATLLLAAVAMLAWHNIWMAVHGRELAQQMTTTAQGVRDGSRQRSVILLVVALAVLREGSETVLFLYGLANTGEAGLRDTLGGGALGLSAGALVAAMLYGGLLRIPVRWFFSVTSVLVLLLAASMGAQATRMLIQADLLPSLAMPLWDLSQVLPQDTAVGTVLHGLIGYEAQPAGMQVLVYGLLLLVIGGGMRWVRTRDTPV